MGIMTSFIVGSPTVFKTLDEDFLRFIFPRLFKFLFFNLYRMFLFFALIFFWNELNSTYLLTPRINKMRDLMITGVGRKKV